MTSSTYGRRSLFSKDRWANVFIKTLYQYRGQAYLLHEFVLMHDHFHLLLTPLASLERAVQFVNGGFSFRAKKELGTRLEVWQRGFSDRRIRDAQDYAVHRAYIHGNPVKKGLCEKAEGYPYSSAFPGHELDAVPQRLKPLVVAGYGAPEGAPFQSEKTGHKVGAATSDRAPEGAP